MDKDQQDLGEHDDYAETIRAEGEFVRALSRRYRRSGIEPDDLQQELWLALLQTKPSRLDSLRPWLATVARRQAQAGQKSAIARRDRERVYSDDRAAAAASTHEVARWADLEAALRRMPPASQELLALRVEQSLSFAEIGEQLGITEAHARVRHHRAITALRRGLGVEETEPGQNAPYALGPLGWVARQFATQPALAVAASVAILLGATMLLRSVIGGVEPEQPAVGVTAQAERDATAQALEAATNPTEPPSPGRTGALGAPERKSTQVPSSAGTADAVGNRAAWYEVQPVSTVRLRVVDSEGNPVMGAEILQHRLLPGRPLSSAAAPRRTDANGYGSIGPVAVGSWVTANSTQSISRAFLIDRPPRQDEIVEVRLAARSRSSTGRIVDPDGAPIPGARVEFVGQGVPRPDHGTDGWLWLDLAPIAAETDADGRYTFRTRHRVSNHPILIHAPGFAMRRLRGPRAKIVLTPHVPLRGVVRDPEGGVAANVIVRLALEQSGLQWTTRADALGRFAFDAPPAGSLTVTACDAEHWGAVGTPHPSQTPLVVRLTGAPLLRGTLTRDEGEPLVGWTIAASAPLNTEATLRSQRIDHRLQSQAVQTDALGQFGDLTPKGASVRLAAFPPGATEPIAVRTVSGSEPPLTWKVGELRTVHTLRGRVSGSGDATTREPYVFVAHDQLPGLQRAEIGPDGTFRVDGLPPGTAYVEHPGFLRDRGPMTEVQVPQTEPLVLRDAALGTMQVRLRTPSGDPVTRGYYQLFLGDPGNQPREIRSLQGTRVRRDEQGVLIVSFSTPAPLFVQALTNEEDLGAGVRFVPVDGSSLDIVLQPVAIRRLDVFPGIETRLDERAQFAIERSTGELVHMRTARDPLRVGQRTRLTVRLAPGDYVLVAPRLNSNDPHREPFRIVDGTKPVRIDLP